MVCQLSMVLMDGHGAALMPSQAHAKPNEEGMLGAFVTETILWNMGVLAVQAIANHSWSSRCKE